MSLMLISLARDADYFGSFPQEVSQRSQGKHVLFTQRGPTPVLLLGMITSLVPMGKEYFDLFHHLTTFSALKASGRSAFH